MASGTIPTTRADIFINNSVYNYNANDLTFYTDNGTKTIFRSLFDNIIPKIISSYVQSDNNRLSDITISFYLTNVSSKLPTDLPAVTNEWVYSYGKFICRRYSTAQDTIDAKILLFAYNSNKIAVKTIQNNNEGEWGIIEPAPMT